MIEVIRDTVHPWSQAPGWDRMTIQAESVKRAVELAHAGRRKFWRLFFQDGAEVIMYKPAGAAAEWDDKDHWMGRNREAARALAVGDVVYTNYSRSITRHAIVDRQDDYEAGKAPPGRVRRCQVSESGVLVLVEPVVPTSGGGWMDPGWFRKAGA